MMKLHTCPKGHNWEAPADEAQPSCPHCQLTVVFAPLPNEDGSPRSGAAGQEAPTLILGSQDEAELPAAVSVPGYKILSVLGRGGMGIVYKARDLRLNRLVALKMILAGAHASPQHMARFHTEAEAAARLQHPNIVQIYDIGEAEAGPGVVHPFMALEFCPGGSLAEYLDGTPVPPRPAAELIETLARAMHYAHQNGILHRDLKPANILLALSDASQKRSPSQRFSEASLNGCAPKITDFGLAKLLQPDSAHPQPSEDPTASGAIMGTPSYMAPEQASGTHQAAGPATDVYALGALLYELLTGRPPFKGTSPLDTVLQVVHVEPVSPRRLQPSVPVDLDTICLKCLHKAPAARYASAGELADDLHRWLHNEPIRGRRISTAGRLVRWCRRNPLLAAVSAGAVVLLLLLSGLYAWSLHRQIGQTRKALRSERSARTELREEHEELLSAREQAEDALARSLYEQARAVRQSLAPGRQWRVLKLLRRAETLRRHRDPKGQRPAGAADTTALPTQAELRSEAVAALLVGDGRVLRRLNAVTPLGCALSRDGSRAVCLWLDEDKREGGIRVCDLRDGRVLTQTRKPLLFSGRFGLSPDGSLLAVPRLRGVELLALPSATPRPRLRLPVLPGVAPPNGTRQVEVAFSADGKRLAVAWAGRERSDLAVWDLLSPNAPEPRYRSRPAGPVRALAFSGDGQTLVYSLGTHTLGTLDLRRGKAAVETVLPLALATSATRGLGLAPQRLACSPTAPLAALACVGPAGKGTLLLWDWEHHVERRRWQGGLDAGGFPVAFSHDGISLAAGAADGSIRCYSLRAGGQTIHLERVHLDGVGLLGWDRAGHLLSAGKYVGALHVWELSRPGIRTAFPLPSGSAHEVALSADGRWLAVRVPKPKPEVLLLRRGEDQTLHRFPLTGPVRAGRLLFRPDSGQLALVTGRHAVIWDVLAPNIGREVLQRRPGDLGLERWFPGAFLADGRLLVAAPRGNSGCDVWDLVGSKMVPPHVNTGRLSWAFLAGGGRFLVVLPVPFVPLGSAGRSIAVWDVQTGQKRAEVRLDHFGTGRGGRNVFWAQLSPDGSRLAWLDLPRAEGAVGVPAETFVSVQELDRPGPPRRIRSDVLPSGATFSPEGRLLLLGFADGSVQLRDACAGVELFRGAAHEGSLKSLAFSADGATIATAAEGADVTLLDLGKLRRRLAVLRLDW